MRTNTTHAFYIAFTLFYLYICHVVKQRRNQIIIFVFLFILCPVILYTRSNTYEYPNTSIKPSKIYSTTTHIQRHSPQERHRQRLYNNYQKTKNNNNKLYKPRKTLHIDISPNYPTVVIIGSTKGGTTTLINILSNHLISFYTLKRNMTPDLHYWTKCLPCNNMNDYNQGISIHDITYKWDINTSNLCTKGNQGIKCTCNDYIHSIIHDKHRKNISLYIAERTSGYMKYPFIAKLFAVHFPNTILLYCIREKITQKYSRWRSFQKRDIRSTVNMAFQHDLIIFQSLRFQKLLLPLINNSNQNDIMRDKIVYEFLRYPMEKGKLRHVLGDLCPYLNVLTWIKILEMYNEKYGFNKFKIIQSEWMFENILNVSVYLQCIVRNYESQNQFDVCYKYYMEYKMDILSEQSLMELSNNSFHKNDGYVYSGLNVNLFDETIKYVKICDMRLFELISEQKYKSLIIGSDWNYDRWVN
eukprot:195084_1